MKLLKTWWLALKDEAKTIEGTPTAEADLLALKDAAGAVANDFKPLLKDFALELLKTL